MSFLAEATARDPHGLALEDGAGRWSYGELNQAAKTVAGELRNLGVGRGQVVALPGVVDRDLLAIMHGIWMAGGAIAPLPESWPPDQRDQAFDVLRPCLFVTGEGAGDDRLPIPSWVDVVRFRPGEGLSGPFLVGVESTSPPVHSEPLPREADFLPGLSDEDPAAHIFTSGTSGVPRAVKITMGNLRASADGSRERLGLKPSDRWLASLAASHVGGVALLTRAALLGSGVVLTGGFRGSGFLTLAETGAITHASLVPTMLHRILKELGGETPPSSLRCLLVGGAPAPESLSRAATDAGFPIALTYGLTEATSQVATAPPHLVREKPGSVGAPLPGVEVDVNDAGELLVRGSTVAPGQAGADGWLRTGDLARRDADGHLWITGRLSDRIISGGVNVDPAVVERALESHPWVVEAAVTGVADAEWGERVVAAIVASTKGDRLRVELAELARSILAPAQRPRDLRFLPSLPRNPNGKLDRKAVQRLFR